MAAGESPSTTLILEWIIEGISTTGSGAKNDRSSAQKHPVKLIASSMPFLLVKMA